MVKNEERFMRRLSSALVAFVALGMFGVVAVAAEKHAGGIGERVPDAASCERAQDRTVGEHVDIVRMALRPWG